MSQTLPDENQSLIGTVRRVGGSGPSYVVLGVDKSIAQIEFPESSEKAELPVQAVKEDPLDR